MPLATMPIARGQPASPPYLPFARFLESLDSLAICLPRQISRTTWKSESPYTATLLAGAYGFLGLADAEGVPTALLRRLAGEPASRPEVLREVLRGAYGGIIDALQKAEPAQELDTALSQFRLAGATHRKATSFLIQACRYAGLALPHSLGGKLRISHSRSRTRTSEEEMDEVTSITVQLRSGGEIKLAGRFNPFTISADDRKFIFKLVDELSEYQAASKRPLEPDSATEDEVPF